MAFILMKLIVILILRSTLLIAIVFRIANVGLQKRKREENRDREKKKGKKGLRGKGLEVS